MKRSSAVRSVPDLKKLEKQARALRPSQKAKLARVLIEDLDPIVNPDAERLWIAEARRRYDAYLAGKLTAVPGEEAMRRARRKLCKSDTCRR